MYQAQSSHYLWKNWNLRKYQKVCLSWSGLQKLQKQPQRAEKCKACQLKLPLLYKFLTLPVQTFKIKHCPFWDDMLVVVPLYGHFAIIAGRKLTKNCWWRKWLSRKKDQSERGRKPKIVHLNNTNNMVGDSKKFLFCYQYICNKQLLHDQASDMLHSGQLFT